MPCMRKSHMPPSFPVGKSRKLWMSPLSSLLLKIFFHEISTSPPYGARKGSLSRLAPLFLILLRVGYVVVNLLSSFGGAMRPLDRRGTQGVALLYCLRSGIDEGAQGRTRHYLFLCWSSGIY